MAEAQAMVFYFFSEIPVPESLANKLMEGENAVFCVKTNRDAAVFTDKRILLAEKQGVTGTKVQFLTIPYKSIVAYAIETAGMLDFDAEIKLILLSGLYVELKISKGADTSKLMRKVYDAITKFVIG